LRDGARAGLAHLDKRNFDVNASIDVIGLDAEDPVTLRGEAIERCEDQGKGREVKLDQELRIVFRACGRRVFRMISMIALNGQRVAQRRTAISQRTISHLIVVHLDMLRSHINLSPSPSLLTSVQKKAIATYLADWYGFPLSE